MGSPDDAGKFLDAYYENKIFENDPFANWIKRGIGFLMQTALRSVKKRILRCTPAYAASMAVTRPR